MDVSGSGFPPAADTRIKRVFGVPSGENTMVPSSLHAPPRPAGASHNVTVTPPATATFFNLPPEKNPIH